MRLENFRMASSTVLEFDGVYIDLHSNYDFCGLSYDVSDKCVVLKWKRCSGLWAEGDIYKSVDLVFNSVQVFGVRPRCNDKPFSEDDSLGYMGYLHPDDIDVMDGFLFPEQARGNYHLIFGFESDLVVKLYSESVELMAGGGKGLDS